MTLSPSKTRAIQNALELRLRRSKGVLLQQFFAALMNKIHGSNFVPTSTDYSKGDLQCDGMLIDPLTIYACYGPVNAGASATEAAIKAAVDKVESDLAGALEKWPSLKEWVLVHNYIGIPAQVLSKVLELKAKHPKITVAMLGKEQFESILLGLTPSEIEELIGDAATDEDFRSLQPRDVLSIVQEIMSSMSVGTPDDQPAVVPEQKLQFNGLSGVCRNRILDGLQNATRVAKLLQGHQDPLLDGRLASIFKQKYLELRAQAFEPDEILFYLEDFAGSASPPTARREVAVWSLLAHLFEKCTIFEDKPLALP